MLRSVSAVYRPGVPPGSRNTLPIIGAMPAMGMVAAPFTRPTSKLLEGMNTPIVPFFINCLVEPTPTAHRIHAFGTALGGFVK